VPLSDHEQKILAQLEESLTKHDPRFAKNVRETNVYNYSARRVRLGVLGFLVGLVVLVAGFSASLYIGLAGVAIMFASALLVERNIRRTAKASWNDITSEADGRELPPRLRRLRNFLRRGKA
jgi:Protein of unknown function (DUF3040)